MLDKVYVRPCMEINLNRVLENYLAFSRAKSNPDTNMAAVVKDNAYGLGDQEIAKILYEQGGCRTFFVAHGFEGSRVRAVAPNADIYVLQGPGQEDLECFRKDNLIPVIASLSQLNFWFQQMPNNQKPALQIETGLNRLGLRPQEIASLDQETRDKFGVVLSHLACADEPGHSQNEFQLKNFQELKSNFPKAKFSLAASDGFLLGPDYQFDIVRLGAVLYGLNPVPNPKVISKNVLQIKAPVIQVADVKPGDCVGYGADYVVKEKGKIAIVSIGYADGVFRSFFPKGKVWFKDQDGWLAAPLAGRVSMDNLICDVSHIPDDVLYKNQYVSLINDSYTADDFGRDAGTIGYEVISVFGHGIRFIKEYVSEDDLKQKDSD